MKSILQSYLHSPSRHGSGALWLRGLLLMLVALLGMTQQAKAKKIYVLSNQNVYVYLYGDGENHGWPGEAATKLTDYAVPSNKSSYSWYVYEAEDKNWSNIILNYNNGTQTGNLTYPSSDGDAFYEYAGSGDPDPKTSSTYKFINILDESGNVVKGYIQNTEDERGNISLTYTPSADTPVYFQVGDQKFDIGTAETYDVTGNEKTYTLSQVSDGAAPALLTLTSGNEYSVIIDTENNTVTVSVNKSVAIRNNGSQIWSGNSGESYTFTPSIQYSLTFTIGGSSYGLATSTDDPGNGSHTYTVEAGQSGTINLPANSSYTVQVFSSGNVYVTGTGQASVVTSDGNTILGHADQGVDFTYSRSDASSIAVIGKIAEQVYGLADGETTEYSGDYQTYKLKAVSSPTDAQALTLPGGRDYTFNIYSNDGGVSYKMFVSGPEKTEEAGTYPDLYLIGDDPFSWTNSGGIKLDIDESTGIGTYVFQTKNVSNRHGGNFRLSTASGSWDSGYYGTNQKDGYHISADTQYDIISGKNNWNMYDCSTSTGYNIITVTFKNDGTGNMIPDKLTFTTTESLPLTIKENSTDVAGALKDSVSYNYNNVSKTDATEYSFVVNGANWGFDTDQTITSPTTGSQTFSAKNGGTGKLKINGGLLGAITLDDKGKVSVTASNDFYNISGTEYLTGYNFEGSTTGSDITVHNKMTQDGNSYTITLPGIVLDGTSTGYDNYEFKVQHNGSFVSGENWPTGTGNYRITTSNTTGYSSAGIYDVTIKFTKNNDTPANSTIETSVLPSSSAPKYLYFDSNADNFGSVSSEKKLEEVVDGHNHTYTYSLDVSDDPEKSNVSDKMQFRFVYSDKDDGSKWCGIGATKSTEGSGTTPSGTEITAFNTDIAAAWVGGTTSGIESGNYNFWFTHNSSTYSAYKFIATYNDESQMWTVRVEPDEPRPTYYLVYNDKSSIPISAKENDAHQVVFSIAKSEWTAADGMNFYIYKVQNHNGADPTYTYYSSANTITRASAITSTENTGTESTTVTLAGTDVADDAPATDISVVFRPRQATANTTVNYSTASEVSSKTAYLMIRNADAGGDWVAVSMWPTRNRDYEFDTSDANPSPMRYGNIQDDNYIFQNIDFKYDDLARILGGLKGGERIEWFVKKSNNQYFYPDADRQSTSMTAVEWLATYQTVNVDHFGNYTYDTSLSADSAVKSDPLFVPDKVYYFTFRENGAVSYTFMFNDNYKPKGTSDQKAKIGFAWNTAMLNQYTQGYYLVGNFENGNAGEAINADLAHSKAMTRYVYSNGLAYEYGLTNGSGFTFTYMDEDGNSHTTSSDNNSSSQWKRHLASNPNSPVDSIVFRVTVSKPVLDGKEQKWKGLYIAVMRGDFIATKNSEHNWNDGWAIRPQVNADYQDHYGYEVDAMALQGGLTTGNRNQSINPDMDEAAKRFGYDSSDDIGSYTFSINVTTSTYRLFLNPILRSGAIILRDYGKNSYFEPRWDYTQQSYVYDKDADGNLVPDYKDYTYVNGRIFLNANGDTLKHYRFFRPWYAEQSYYLDRAADNLLIDQFYVSRIDTLDGVAKLTLQQVAWPKIDDSSDPSARNRKVLYAGVPLILAMDVKNDFVDKFWDGTDFPVYAEDDKGNITTYGYKERDILHDASSWSAMNEYYIKATPMNVARLFPGDAMPQYTGTVDSLSIHQIYYKYNDDGSLQEAGYTFKFGFYNHDDWPSGTTLIPTVTKDLEGHDLTQADLGFFIVSSQYENKTYANDAYLELPAYWVRNQHTGASVTFPSSAKANIKASQKARKAPAANAVAEAQPDGTGLTFSVNLLPSKAHKSVVNGGQVTGITEVSTDVSKKDASSEAWYTLQGIRIDKPAQRGIYIHNGKKVIVK